MHIIVFTIVLIMHTLTHLSMKWVMHIIMHIKTNMQYA